MRERAPTLLVIEDARDQAVLLGVAAQRAHPGLDVQMAGDGREGIAYLAGTAPYDDRKAHPVPDLVILDLMMPEVDGFEVLAWIGAQSGFPEIPLVVLTASVDPRDEARALELGATAVFSKPKGLAELDEVAQKIVHRWIGRGEIIGAHIWASG